MDMQLMYYSNGVQGTAGTYWRLLLNGYNGGAGGVNHGVYNPSMDVLPTNLSNLDLSYLWPFRMGKKIKTVAKTVECKVCGITLNSESQAKQHFNGKNHLRKLRQSLASSSGSDEGTDGKPLAITSGKNSDPSNTEGQGQTEGQAADKDEGQRSLTEDGAAVQTPDSRSEKEENLNNESGTSQSEAEEGKTGSETSPSPVVENGTPTENGVDHHELSVTPSLSSDPCEVKPDSVNDNGSTGQENLSPLPLHDPRINKPNEFRRSSLERDITRNQEPVFSHTNPICNLLEKPKEPRALSRTRYSVAAPRVNGFHAGIPAATGWQGTQCGLLPEHALPNGLLSDPATAPPTHSILGEPPPAPTTYMMAPTANPTPAAPYRSALTAPTTLPLVPYPTTVAPAAVTPGYDSSHVVPPTMVYANYNQISMPNAGRQPLAQNQIIYGQMLASGNTAGYQQQAYIQQSLVSIPGGSTSLPTGGATVSEVLPPVVSQGQQMAPALVSPPQPSPPCRASPQSSAESDKLDPVSKAIYDNIMGKLPRKRKLEIPCAVCDMIFNSEVQADQHFKGVRHTKRLKMVEDMKKSLQPNNNTSSMPEPVQDCRSHSQSPAEGIRGSLYCSFCDISVNSQQQLEIHREGVLHKKNVECKRARQSGAGGPAKVLELPGHVPGKFYCKTCDISVHSASQLQQHVSSLSHQDRQAGKTLCLQAT